MDKSKIAPKLLAVLEQPPAFGAEAMDIPVIARYRQDAIRSRTIREGVEATHVFKLTPTVAATMKAGTVSSLSEEQAIEYIWLDEEIRTCLDRSVSAIDVAPLWAAG